MRSNRKKSKNKRAKSKTGNAKRVKTAARSRSAATPNRLKRSAKKKQAKKKTTAARRVDRNQRTQERSAQQFESARSRPVSVSGRQSGDLQGLSRAERADSESVEELVGEGNVFEAGAVAGVEEADNAEEKEVHTQEVPEDDVPQEYLDEE